VEFYPWVVIGHVVVVILAFGAHGVSAFAMFRVKTEPDRARAAAVLDLSTMGLAVAGVALLIAVVLGIVAAVMAGYFGRLWPWAAIVVVVVAWLAMTPMAANPMSGVRRELGLPTRNDQKGVPPQPGSDEAFAAARARLRPELVAGTGVLAIVILVWLMETKPF
jgi:ABC-type amino acid transport system permease subunit